MQLIPYITSIKIAMSPDVLQCIVIFFALLELRWARPLHDTIGLRAGSLTPLPYTIEATFSIDLFLD